MKNLSNNHESMKTVVETFLTEETVDLIYDNEQLDKWNAHVAELGLAGQTRIVKKEKSPIPFMHLKTSHKNICETLCPSKVKVEEYALTPIPVEILDVIALAKKENHFDRIEVWYDDKSPDPFVIGINPAEYYVRDGDGYKYFKTREEAKSFAKENGDKEVSSSSWNVNYYLLGKWADVKRSWNELRQMATERFKLSKENQYRKEIKENQRKLEDLDHEAFEHFN